MHKTEKYNNIGKRSLELVSQWEWQTALTL